MKVRDFLKAFGGDKIEGKTVMSYGIKYNIYFRDEDTKKSFLMSNWPNKETFYNYIENAHYRLRAISDKKSSIWVNPDSIIIDATKTKPCSLVLRLMDKNISYQKALKSAMRIFIVDKAELEKELDLYI